MSISRANASASCGTSPWRLSARLPLAARKEDIEDGCQEQSEGRDADHSGEHRHTHRAAHLRSRRRWRRRAAPHPSRSAAEVIEDRAQPQARRLDRCGDRRLPANSSSRANSTMRIAFLADNPTSTMRPICVKMLLSPCVSHTPEERGQQRHRHDQDDRRAAAQGSRRARRAPGTPAGSRAGTPTRANCRRGSPGR